MKVASEELSINLVSTIGSDKKLRDLDKTTKALRKGLYRMDKERVMDIIGTAFNTASGEGLEAIGDTPVDKVMTSEQVQKLNLTKEALIEAFLQDPRVVSANCKDGTFRVVTDEGTINFNFVFDDERSCGRVIKSDA